MGIVHPSLSPHFRAEVKVRNPALIDIDAPDFVLQVLEHFFGVKHAENLASLRVTMVGNSLHNSVGHVEILFHNLSHVS